MRSVVETSLAIPTARDRNRAVLCRIADTLGCRPETILDAAGSDAYPDETAEMVRLWFKLQDGGARAALLEQGRAMASTSKRHHS